MKKILVVDDEENIRYLYKHVLEEEGVKVEVAKDGEEALAKFSLYQPDLVTLQFKGLRVAERTRAAVKSRMTGEKPLTGILSHLCSGLARLGSVKRGSAGGCPVEHLQSGDP